jgi:4-alpha-glucanotransferase
MYSEDGQYWGFPLYNWDVLEKDDFHWWKVRLNVASNFYHIYRLDHIVGFFKIWAIPEGKKAKEGFFIPQDPAQWIPQGEKILRTLCQNSMLPIGEDLGAVPPNVRECMQRLGIAGTKVMRWERRWDGDQSFILPSDYPPLSMTTLSTHDSETLAEWWEKFSQEAEQFALAMRLLCPEPLDSATRIDILKLSHQSASLFHINLLQEYLDAFEELSWENPEDDRINIPGKVLDRNWTYRFRPTQGAICSHEELRRMMQGLMPREAD